MSGAKNKTRLSSVSSLGLQPASVSVAGEVEFGLGLTVDGRRLAVLAPTGSAVLADFEGRTGTYGGKILLEGPTSPTNAAGLRKHLPWLRPRNLGLSTSVGLGDRLGLATPGHIRAVRAAGGGIAPIFAQQSIREMERTGRSPGQVMDDAAWGVFSEGWDGGFGADADHLKTTNDIDVCLAAGYTFFTFDPGDHVDDAAESARPHELRAALERLPWERVEDSPADLMSRYLDRPFEFEGHFVKFDERTLRVAAMKYGRAVSHVVAMFRHLERTAGVREFEVEVSVDETASPTTHAQHVYLANELKRLGVRWVSMAPRYVGAFEKGVDFIGDVEEFEADFAVHAAIARRFGPYKLSLHSGSDKFSIYPAAARQTHGLVHLKTAGTSYLEALRTLAELDPDSFRELYSFCRERYEEDRKSYHVSASLDVAPLLCDMDDAALLGLLEQFDARQILHVTFGSVLGGARSEAERRRHEHFTRLLETHRAAYAANLEAHFLRHLEPFNAEVRGA